MSEKLPLPTFIALNQEQKEEVPDYAQKIYNITDATPTLITHKNSIVVINDDPISAYPIIKLPEEPEIGSIVNVLQGKKNGLSVSGNGKNILINYIKYATEAITTFSDSHLFLTKGEAFAPNTGCSFSICYNGTEWQSLDLSLLVNIQVLNNSDTFTASRYYGMIEEANKTSVLLTFTYSDTFGNLYPGKTISLTADKTAFISPTSAVTNNVGVANFNVSCGQLGGTIYTAHFLGIYDEELTMNLTINYYNDNSTIVSDKKEVYGSDDAKLTVTIKDTANNLYNNKNVVCSSDQKLDVITTVSDPTDNNGEATFTISSPEAHTSIVSAQNATDDYTIADTVTITFIETPPIPVLPTDQIDSRIESDVGVVYTNVNEVLYWLDQISGNYLEGYDSTFIKRLQNTSYTTPSGMPSFTAIPYYYIYYNNTFSVVPQGYSSPRTICFIGKFPSNGGYIRYYLGNPYANYGRFDLGNQAPSNMISSIYNGTSGISYDYVDKWRVFLVTNADVDTTYFYLDNVFLGTVDTGLPQVANSWIGFATDTVPQDNCYIAAAYSWHKALTEEERTQVYNYAVAKFGV